MNIANKIVLGTVQFGLPYGINNNVGKISQSEVAKILSEAKKNEISLIDTSYAYGDSEIVIGSIPKASREFKIVSKLPRTTKKPKVVFNETIHRLKTNKLYGYLIHHFDYFKENLSIWTEIKSLKEDGQVEKIGFSLYSTLELEYLFSKNIEFDIVQIPYNILDRAFAPYLKELKQHNVEIHARSVFLQGLFFKSTDDLPDRLQPLKPYLMTMDKFCSEHDITIESLALNGVLHNPDIDGVLIGVDSLTQLQKNIQSVWSKMPVGVSKFIQLLDVKEKELLNPVNWNI